MIKYTTCLSPLTGILSSIDFEPYCRYTTYITYNTVIWGSAAHTKPSLPFLAENGFTAVIN